MARARNEIHNKCGERSPRELERAIRSLARRQHDVARRDQLHELGMSDRAIDYRVAIGRMSRLYRAVFHLGHGRLTPEGQWTAAVFAAGEGAVLSHEAAAALWDLRPAKRGDIDVTVPAKRRKQAGIRPHHGHLRPNEVRQRKGIPVTSPARTLLDLAPTLNQKRLERAIRQAEYHRLATGGSLTSCLSQHEGRAGSKALRKAIEAADVGTGKTRSDLEDDFRRFLRKHKLPQPERNAIIDLGDEEIEVDCLWREQRVIAELDGEDAHRTRDAFHRDRRRDLRLIAAGWRPVRITNRALSDDKRLARDLCPLLG